MKSCARIVRTLCSGCAARLQVIGSLIQNDGHDQIQVRGLQPLAGSAERPLSGFADRANHSLDYAMAIRSIRRRCLLADGEEIGRFQELS